jgi:hypothetical protein
MAKLIDRQVLLAKNETIYGSDPTPTAAANAIPIVEKAKIEFDPEMLERKHPLPSRGRPKPLTGARATKLSYKVELFGSGVATTPPRIGDHFEACGFGETIGASDVSYSPVSVGAKSNTKYVYIDGLLYKVFGAVGNVKISGKAGKPVECDFDMMGLYQNNSDVTIVAPTFESNYKIPPQMLSAVFTLDSITTFGLREFNIDMGIPIIKRLDGTGATGYAGFLSGKQNPTGSIIIEGPAKATYDFLDKFEKATEVAASLVIGATAGNIWTITIPQLSFTNVKVNDADGLVVFELPISLNIASPSGSEITLKHT